MTRRASILAYCLVIALGLLGLQSWDIAVGRVEKRVIAEVEERTGLLLSGMQRAEIALLPLPRISLVDVGFTHTEAGLTGSAARIKARARLLPLLVGRISFDRIDLVAPQIAVEIPEGEPGLGDWLQRPLAGLEHLRHQSRIAIAGGSVFLRRQGAIESILRDVNLFVGARETGQPLDLSGSLTWRGVPTEVALIWPMAAGRGRVMLSANATPMKLRFEGTRSSPQDGVITGQTTLSAPSLPDLLAWFGEQPRLAAATGALSLTADTVVKPHEVSLGTVSIGLDGDRLDGALKLSDAGGRLALAGTLAGAELDLGRLLGRLPLRAVTTADTAPLAFDAWTAQDIDLRISVDTARLNGARLSDVATYLLVKKGRFETGLLRASAYGGTAKGRFLASATPAGVDIKLQGVLDRINLGQFAGDAQPLRLGGTGNLQFALDGIGNTTEQLLSSLSGKASLALRQGEIGGIALAELLRRSEAGPLAALRSDWRHGKTAFDTASLQLGIVNGIAAVTEGVLTAPAYRATLAGQIALPTRRIDMGLQLVSANGGQFLPFTLRGELDNPTLDLDSEALTRRAFTLPTNLSR